MRYDTILFDADETLLDFHKSEREAVADAMREVGIDPTDEMIATYSAINATLWRALERREITKAVLLYRRFEIFFDRYGISGGEPLAKKTAEAYMRYLSEKGYLLDGALSLCQRLHGKARLYIVTNGVEFIQRGRYARSGLDAYIEDAFISDVTGYEKPHIGYFEYVAAHVPDFCRERTLMVGDSLTSDMKGGVGFGLDTCWYNPKGLPPTEALAGKITYTVATHEQIYQLITEGANS